jgi:F-type H+-transporting ATPase subunit b
MDILNQLSGLLLGAVPTIVLFILLVIAYSLLVGKPLERTLVERRARTTGAVEQARGAIAAAEAETAVYEDKLRAARAEVLAEREKRMQALQAERETALRTARESAQQRVRTAKDEIDASAAVARQHIETAAAQLSDSILRAVLPKGASVAEARQ